MNEEEEVGRLGQKGAERWGMGGRGQHRQSVGTGVRSGCAVKSVQLRGLISGQKICTTIAPTG